MISWQIPLARWSRIHAERSDEEIQRSVRTIALARTLLAIFSLVAIYLDPTEPTRFATLTYSLMTFYVAFALAASVAVRAWPRMPRRVHLLSHVVDLVWATAMTFLTEGPNSPFYVFYLFVLLATAYRWGLRETLQTAFVLDGLMLLQAYVVWGSPLVDVPLELNRLILRCSYITLMGFLAGFLAEAEKQARVEATVSSRVTGRIKAETGVRGALQVVFDSLLSLFGARRVLLLLGETTTNRKYLWEGRPLAGMEGCLLHFAELDAGKHDLSRFPRMVAWQALMSDGRVAELIGLATPQGAVKRLAGHEIPGSVLSAWSFRTALGMRVAFGPEWEGQLLILDPHFGRANRAEFHLVIGLIRQIEPVIYSLYLYRRLRSRVGAMERARVARELHDGVIQSLISLELQLSAVRSQAEGNPAMLSAELASIQTQLHQEVLQVRELMEEMKPNPIGGRELLDSLADRVDRFRRNTGISARFVTDLDEALLPPRIGREVIRILQEALVNIRKHSSARNAMVRFSSQNGNWLLIIEDDGKGMGFAGRRTLAELMSLRAGPAILKERVRAISGDLAIESKSGGGCRLEITVPQRPLG